MNKISVNNVAPVLRILLGDNERFPIIRFRNQISATSKGCLDIHIAQNSSQEQIIEILRKKIGRKTAAVKSVYIEGIGLFNVLSLPENLTGRVAGKAAVVTGAAQGFGRQIAGDMIAEGAFVFLADINKQQIRRQAGILAQRYGPDRAFALDMDVTSSKSVAKALNKVVKLFGGFDILISNAGVLRAESVKTQLERDFDFVTSVNYKGYFLCTQAAAEILALQHKVNPAYMSDIIQINSKSGLQGSDRNSAYAGSKFGSIGLTQSFALELIGDGIKVNSVCPGNFFDGPLWSDPKNGLLVQYLRTGKVPGAKTIEDVRRAYEAKVPMKRGCTTSDVMKAVYYLIEQKYETGQAVPVTGGQVMLH
jgi:sorbitol-6-phosphate 2-dehydrogenase